MSEAPILLLGASGQLGWALAPLLALQAPLVAPSRAELDLGDAAALRARLDALRPQGIVNAAAYTAVDRAETETALAWRLNAEMPGELARWAAAHGAWLMHYSTDYVFDGTGQRPWREDDVPRPVNAYGRSKRAGEVFVLESGARALILRVSWLYGLHGANFLKTMLRLGASRPVVRVVADQVGAPTGTGLVAAVSAELVRRLRSAPDACPTGLYHLAPTGEASWYDYAAFVFERARAAGWPLVLERLEPIASADYPTAAPRPANSRLDTTRLATTFGLRLPPWQDEVARTVAVLAEPLSLLSPLMQKS
ncbi:dTDP-4-dehydrorhamnose reductase [Tepidiphilus sp. J10]|uniref:dTDP-4-dehydrorhamnose reductase n=1 Tax=Tepidiphilus sp. J10 TaxID=2502185 RepID=UPI00115D5C1F|nr:dTDP-4-dehydrorhamnose reductase [Tepidiphilus sp. J10]